MNEILTLLRAVYEVAIRLHNPLQHALVRDERSCPTCKFNRKLQKLLTEPQQ